MAVATPTPSATITLSLDAIPTSALRPYARLDSLMIATDLVESEDEYILLPHVMNVPNSERFNESIASLLEDALDEIDRTVYGEYTIETYSSEILSLVLRFYDMESGMPCGVYPITFDLQSGKEQRLCAYFDDDDGRWRRILPDIITQQAEKQGITLLSELLPITDEQGFYISGTDLVLIYHPYEIATYEAGVPEFSIPIKNLEELLSDNSALLSLTEELAVEEALAFSAATDSPIK